MEEGVRAHVQGLRPYENNEGISEGGEGGELRLIKCLLSVDSSTLHQSFNPHINHPLDEQSTHYTDES